MTVWVEPMRDRILGKCYAISCEYHDAYVYTADSVSEAVKKYEEDKNVKVDDVKVIGVNEKMSRIEESLYRTQNIELNEALSLTEKKWPYQLKNGTKLRKAIHDENHKEVMQAIYDCYEELKDNGLIDEEDFESYTQDFELYLYDDFSDWDDPDEVVNYELNDLYDLCDNIGVWVSLEESKHRKSRKRKLTEADSKDIIEYRAVLADMNFYTINKCKDILKSYNLEFMYVTFDKYGGYPYIEFRGSKQDIIKFLTSDFCGESEDDLRKRKPELFESKQRIDGKRKLNEWANPDDTFFWDIKGMVNPKHVGDLVTGTEIENWFKQSQKDDDPLTRGYATLDDWWADTDTTKYFKYYDIYEED